ncbi:YeeE/YedE thiosulfate transporter family protein, partial [Anoxybacillus sp. LAT_11]
LYHIGGGDANGIVTLIGFIAGSVIATTHFDVWAKMPQWKPFSFIGEFGALGGFLLQLVLLAAVYYVVTVAEKRRYGQLVATSLENRHGWKAIYKGPWSLLVGALLLAVTNALVLMI